MRMLEYSSVIIITVDGLSLDVERHQPLDLILDLRTFVHSDSFVFSRFNSTETLVTCVGVFAMSLTTKEVKRSHSSI